MFKHVLFSAKFFVTKIIYYLYCIGKKIDKKILFISFGGKQYSDNPRAISEKMHELYPEYKIVWYIKNKEIYENYIPNYVKVIDNRISFYKELSTSFCYITNTENGPNIFKRKNQFFIQTWHGDRVPKKVLYNADDLSKLFFEICDDKITDLCISGSAIGTEVYRTAFKYSGEILEKGMPRNDKLVYPNDKESNTIRQKLGIKDDCKILLYAPTFRDNNFKNKQDVNVDLIRLKDILEADGTKWKILVRAHSASSGFNINNKEYIDVTYYPDMADLLLVSDILITDYSSCSGDFILKDNLVVLAMFDYDSYVNDCRTLAFVPSEVGYFVAYNQEMLEEIISNSTDEDIKQNCNKLCENFQIKESGRSSEIICNIICDKYRILWEKK